jgi:predicted RNA-binding protein associated with RNAse of E/G family
MAQQAAALQNVVTNMQFLNAFYFLRQILTLLVQNELPLDFLRYYGVDLTTPRVPFAMRQGS